MKNNNNVTPTLVRLCYETVFQNRKKLKIYHNYLPLILTRSLNEYIENKIIANAYITASLKYFNDNNKEFCSLRFYVLSLFFNVYLKSVIEKIDKNLLISSEDLFTDSNITSLNEYWMTAIFYLGVQNIVDSFIKWENPQFQKYLKVLTQINWKKKYLSTIL